MDVGHDIIIVLYLGMNLSLSTGIHNAGGEPSQNVKRLREDLKYSIYVVGVANTTESTVSGIQLLQQ